jgi:hypothetical protein
LTRTGRKQLERNADAWRQMAGAVGQVLDLT